MLLDTLAMMRCLPKVWQSHASLGEAVIIGNANIICRRQTSLKKPRSEERGFFWSWWRDLNPRPTDYESVALPLRHTSIKRWYYTLTNEICQEVLAFLHVPSRSFHHTCSCCLQLKLAFSTNICYTV